LYHSVFQSEITHTHGRYSPGTTEADSERDDIISTHCGPHRRRLLVGLYARTVLKAAKFIVSD